MKSLTTLALGLLVAVGLAQPVHVSQVLFERTTMLTHQGNRVTLVLSGPAPAGTVALVGDDTALISTPKYVPFAEGATEASFPIYCGGNYQGWYTEHLDVNVWASVFGGPVANGVLEILPSPIFSYVAVWDNYYDYRYDVYGGDSFLVMVTIHPEGCGIFTFTDSSPIVSGLPPQPLCDYNWYRLYTLPVTISTPVFLQAHNGGFISEWPITVHPKPRLTAFELIPNSVVGGSPSSGRLTFDQMGRAGEFPVSVFDSSILVTTPTTVAVPGGVLTHDFTIATAPVNKSYSVTIRARYRDVTKTAFLTVHP